jgi:Tol biopolymer transport system component
MRMGFRNGFGDVSRDGQRFVFAVPPPRLAEDFQQITVLDRDGNVVSRVGEPGLYSELAFSPDGSRVAVMRGDLETGNEDVWTFDVSTGEGLPVTSDAFDNWSVAWSPDGTHVAYSSGRATNYGIYRKAWNGTGSEELLFPAYAPGADVALMDYSADGRFLSFESGEIVLVVPLTGTDPFAREPIEFVREEFTARGGWFSPDGRFLAYTSTESGRWEVWVRSFDASSGTAPAEETWQVTEDGARLAFWRQDGKEIIYVTRDRERMDSKVMAVDVTTTPEFQIGTPRLLFRVRDSGEDLRWMMDVRADGQRFVFTMPVASGTPAP